MKYENGSWTPVGLPGFSVYDVSSTDIAIDSSGTPYVVYMDYSKYQRATVMKLSTYSIDLSPADNYNFASQMKDIHKCQQKV